MRYRAPEGLFVTDPGRVPDSVPAHARDEFRAACAAVTKIGHQGKAWQRVAEINAELAGLEEEYAMSSNEMKAAVTRGGVSADHPDAVRWLELMDERARLEARMNHGRDGTD
jgi:hypothetical protein